LRLALCAKTVANLAVCSIRPGLSISLGANMSSAVYDSMNRVWKSTCKVLFGQEAGELSHCAEWLSSYNEQLRLENSAISGKQVALSQNGYAKSAKFLAFDEVDFEKRFEPLSINEIKDIDSLLGAISERSFYVGNVILGKSSNVQNSSNVVDSHFVLDSIMVTGSKYIGYSTYVGMGEYCFGLYGSEKVTHAVKCMGSELTRCFECHMGELTSDCYYCAKAQNCQECMFCFGTENQSFMIGNTKLPRDKYLSLKKKLLQEMAGTIKKQGKAFSLLELIEKAGKHRPDSRLKFKLEKEKPFNAKPIEQAFSKTAGLLFGRELAGLEDYSGFLQKHVPKNITTKSPLTGNMVVACGYRTQLLKRYGLGNRIATDDELREIGRIGVGIPEAEKMAFDIGKASEILHPIAYTNLDKVFGKINNCKDASVNINSQDCLSGSAYIRSRKCSHCFWPSDDEAAFGCSATHFSTFCINCYYSKGMMRAFECDGCNGCSDVYFLHNCENLQNSMFCFNIRNKHYAIGNSVLPADQYKKVKQALVGQMAQELEAKKSLKWDIFNVGGRK